jgi:hypothetical protein
VVIYYFLKNTQISLLLLAFNIFIWLKIKARQDTQNKLHVKYKDYVFFMLIRAYRERFLLAKK